MTAAEDVARLRAELVAIDAEIARLPVQARRHVARLEELETARVRVDDVLACEHAFNAEQIADTRALIDRMESGESITAAKREGRMVLLTRMRAIAREHGDDLRAQLADLRQRNAYPSEIVAVLVARSKNKSLMIEIESVLAAFAGLR